MYQYVKMPMLRIAQLYLFVAAILRGIDYVCRDHLLAVGAPQLWATNFAENAAPLWVWGLILIGLGVAGLIGELMYQWGQKKGCRSRLFRKGCFETAWLAHCLLFACYTVFGICALISVFSQGWGWTAPVEILGYSLGHVVFASAHRQGVSWR